MPITDLLLLLGDAEAETTGFADTLTREAQPKYRVIPRIQNDVSGQIHPDSLVIRTTRTVMMVDVHIVDVHVEVSPPHNDLIASQSYTVGNADEERQVAYEIVQLADSINARALHHAIPSQIAKAEVLANNTHVFTAAADALVKYLKQQNDELKTRNTVLQIRLKAAQAEIHRMTTLANNVTDAARSLSMVADTKDKGWLDTSRLNLGNAVAAIGVAGLGLLTFVAGDYIDQTDERIEAHLADIKVLMAESNACHVAITGEQIAALGLPPSPYDDSEVF